MNITQNFARLTNNVDRFITKRSPELLAGAAIACFIASTVSAVAATPKAVKAIEEKKKKLNLEESSAEENKVPVKEVVKTTWKLYLPSALTCVGGICFVASSVSESNRRYLALGTSYQLLQDFTHTYRNKVIETIGEKKEEKIRSEMRQDKIDQNPPVTNVNVYTPAADGSYKTLFYEPITGRYFWENRTKVEKAIIKMNKEMKNSFENQYSVYSWLRLLPEDLMKGIPEGMMDRYMDIGWPTFTMYDNDILEVEIKSGGEVHGGEWDGYPCLVLEYSEWPSSDFRSGY